MSKNIFCKISHKNGFLTFPCKMHRDAPYGAFKSVLCVRMQVTYQDIVSWYFVPR